MKAALLLYIKCFLFMGIPFALVMTLLHLLEGDSFQWPRFLFLLVGYGGLMSLTLVTMHLKMLKAAGITTFTPENIKVSHEKFFTSSLNHRDLAERLKHDPDFRWRKFIQKDNEIIIHTASSFWSWGEKIIIRLDRTENGLHYLTVTSTPSSKTTIVDFGRNLSNMMKLENKLQHV